MKHIKLRGEYMMKKILIGISLCVAFGYGEVDINSASISELTTIKGIGEKRAEAIIKYRQEECFKKPEDLMNISGIGKKTFEKIKKDIIVGKCPSKEAATAKETNTTKNR